MTLEAAQLAVQLGNFRLTRLVRKLANAAVQGMTEGVIQQQRALDLEAALIEKAAKKGGRKAITRTVTIRGREG